MSRRAIGKIVFEYDMEEEPYDEKFDEATADEEKIKYFTNMMVEDIIHLSYSDLAPCIEMEII